MAKDSLVVHVWKLLKKKKNHKINFFNKVEEKKITEEEFIPLLGLKKKKKVCTTFIVFMINLANLKINYQHLSLSLNWTY